jgi:hypothetical protein
MLIGSFMVLQSPLATSSDMFGRAAKGVNERTE